MDESKEDLVSQAAEKEQSIAKLSDSIVAARRWRERALQFAIII